MNGPSNPNWRGGRRDHPLGYVMVYAPDHPAAHNGAVLEHRLVVEREIGRLLRPDEVVHHVNGDKRDNRPGNLRVMSQSEHARIHYHEVLSPHAYVRPPAVRFPRTCAWCSEPFEAVGKRQSGRRFCARSCYWAYRIDGGRLSKGRAA